MLRGDLLLRDGCAELAVLAEGGAARGARLPGAHRQPHHHPRLVEDRLQQVMIQLEVFPLRFLDVKSIYD